MKSTCSLARRLLVSWALTAAGLSLAQPAGLPPRAAAVADFTVFADPPTGFVFVKLPAGWKFVGHVSPEHLHDLPCHLVTRLLLPDASGEPRGGTICGPAKAARTACGAAGSRRPAGVEETPITPAESVGASALD